jgi:hypothetical protein
MADVILEMEETLRRERMEKLWKTYGNYVIGFFLMIVLLVAGYESYTAWNRHTRLKNTEQLMAILDSAEFPGNIEKISTISGPAKGIGFMLAAGALLEDDKKAEALKIYDQAATDKFVSPDVRGLAVLMRARLSQSMPDAAQDKIMAGLEPLLRDHISPWRPYALIESASIAASNNDFTAALETIKQAISAENMPPSFYAKARALEKKYTIKAARADQKNKKNNPENKS